MFESDELVLISLVLFSVQFDVVFIRWCSFYVGNHGVGGDETFFVSSIDESLSKTRGHI